MRCVRENKTRCHDAGGGGGRAVWGPSPTPLPSSDGPVYLHTLCADSPRAMRWACGRPIDTKTNPRFPHPHTAHPPRRLPTRRRHRLPHRRRAVSAPPPERRRGRPHVARRVCGRTDRRAAERQQRRAEARAAAHGDGRGERDVCVGVVDTRRETKARHTPTPPLFSFISPPPAATRSYGPSSRPPPSKPTLPPPC